MDGYSGDQVHVCVVKGHAGVGGGPGGGWERAGGPWVVGMGCLDPEGWMGGGYAVVESMGGPQSS